MTTVLYHPATKTIYADTQITANGIVVGEQSKISIHKNVAICFSGRMEFFWPFCDYVLNNKPFGIPDEHGFQALTVFHCGHVRCYDSSTDYTQEESDLYTIGSGSFIAMGAYHATKDPVAAITSASKLDIYTGNKIEIVKLWSDERKYLCIQ